MKKMIVLIIAAMMGISSVSLACEKYEAQFVGFVTIAQEVEDGCVLDITFDLYNTHFFCPLLQEDAEQGTILVDRKTCDAMANTHTGGYLSTDFKSNFISLEL